MIFNLIKRKNKYTGSNTKNILNGSFYVSYAPGISYVNNDDGSFTLNGKSAPFSSLCDLFEYNLGNDDDPDDVAAFEIGKTYKFIYNDIGPVNENVVTLSTKNRPGFNHYKMGESFTIDSEITYLAIGFYLDGSRNYDNYTVYPMVCLASASDTWESNKLSNGALTDKLNKIYVKLSKAIDTIKAALDSKCDKDMFISKVIHIPADVTLNANTSGSRTSVNIQIPGYTPLAIRAQNTGNTVIIFHRFYINDTTLVFWLRNTGATTQTATTADAYITVLYGKGVKVSDAPSTQSLDE